MQKAHGGGNAFLEAGAEPCVLAPVRPHSTRKKGLSHEEEPNDVLITVDGEMLPKDLVERDAEQQE